MDYTLSSASLTAAVRTRGGEDLGAMDLEAFAALLGEEVRTRAIK